jgi:nucleoside-diphosphate-sugar epimerase
MLGYGPISDALTKNLMSAGFKVLIVSDHAKNNQKFSVISRLKMIELRNKLEARVIIVSTRADKWESNEHYENLIASLLMINPARVILLSSVSVYGDSDLPRNESSVIEPVTKYGNSKALEEQILTRHIYGSSDLSILRISNVFGHKLFDDFVNHVFLNAKESKPIRLIDDGKTTRNFIWFNDLIEILLKIISLDSLPKILNIGTPKSINLKSLIFEIEKILQKKLVVIESDLNLDIVANSIIDTSLLNQIIDVRTTQLIPALESYFSESLDDSASS